MLNQYATDSLYPMRMDSINDTNHQAVATQSMPLPTVHFNENAAKNGGAFDYCQNVNGPDNSLLSMPEPTIATPIGFPLRHLWPTNFHSVPIDTMENEVNGNTSAEIDDRMLIDPMQMEQDSGPSLQCTNRNSYVSS